MYKRQNKYSNINNNRKAGDAVHITNIDVKEKGVKFLKYIPFVLSVLIIIFCVVFVVRNDFDDILSYTPENLWLAAAVFWGFYGLKSMSVVFPLTALFISVGHLYPFWAAMLVNIVGLCVSFTIPYLVGRISGSGIVDTVSRKYPKARKIINYGHDNNLFASYISRAVVVVPGDIVSILHGALKMPYRPYLIGSLFGVFPEMAVQTYIGGQLNQLTLKSVLVMIGLILLTLAVSIALNKKVSKMGRQTDKEDFYE